MRKICAWCKKQLDYKPRKTGDRSGPISHGMCPDCLRHYLSSKARTLHEFLNQFNHPVYLVDSNIRILSANKKGLDYLEQNNEQIHAKDISMFDCRYSSRPDGCGRPMHCKCCTIKKAVEQTYRTGKSLTNIPAYPDLHFLTGENCIKFLISTKKTGTGILLRIDEKRESTQ